MYKKMYYKLFNAITDALALIESKNPARAAELLRRAQQGTEEIYIEWDNVCEPEAWAGRVTDSTPGPAPRRAPGSAGQ